MAAPLYRDPSGCHLDCSRNRSGGPMPSSPQAAPRSPVLMYRPVVSSVSASSAPRRRPAPPCISIASCSEIPSPTRPPQSAGRQTPSEPSSFLSHGGCNQQAPAEPSTFRCQNVSPNCKENVSPNRKMFLGMSRVASSRQSAIARRPPSTGVGRPAEVGPPRRPPSLGRGPSPCGAVVQRDRSPSAHAACSPMRPRTLSPKPRQPPGRQGRPVRSAAVPARPAGGAEARSQSPGAPMKQQPMVGSGAGSMSALPLAAQAQMVACTTPLSRTASLMVAQAPTPSDKHRPPGRIGRAARCVSATAFAADKPALHQPPSHVERQPLAERHLQATVPGCRGTAWNAKEPPPHANVVEPISAPVRQPQPRHAYLEKTLAATQSNSHVPSPVASYTPPPLMTASSYTPPLQRSASHVPAPVAVVSYLPPASAAHSPSTAAVASSPAPARLGGPSSPGSGSSIYGRMGRMPSVHAVPASWKGAGYTGGLRV